MLPPQRLTRGVSLYPDKRDGMFAHLDIKVLLEFKGKDIPVRTGDSNSGGTGLVKIVVGENPSLSDPLFFYANGTNITSKNVTIRLADCLDLL